MIYISKKLIKRREHRPEMLEYIEDTMQTLKDFSTQLSQQQDTAQIHMGMWQTSQNIPFPNEYKLLGYNFNFIPTPTRFNHNHNDISNFGRKLKLKVHISNT